LNNDVEKYLTIEQVAQMLQLQPETIRNMARAQRIPAILSCPTGACLLPSYF